MNKSKSDQVLGRSFELSPGVKEVIGRANVCLAHAAKLATLYQSALAELATAGDELKILEGAQTEADVAFRAGAAEANAAALERSLEAAIEKLDAKTKAVKRLELTVAALATKAKAADVQVAAIKQELLQAKTTFSAELRSQISDEMRESLNPFVTAVKRGSAAFLAIRAGDQNTLFLEGLRVPDPEDHLRPFIENGRFKLEDGSTVHIAELAVDQSLAVTTAPLRPLALAISALAAHQAYNAPRVSDEQRAREEAERRAELAANEEASRQAAEIRSRPATSTGVVLDAGARG